ncbi:hypothetical protein O3M35_009902 [Rhynocoris fuscipes]|uniref:Uncharacterized protein n=1 Tax=Rhynocoris fuscipes TaxID=488301 RepID=A0AAW1DAK7_9HEMI
MIDCKDSLSDILQVLEDAGINVANYTKACGIPKEPQYNQHFSLLIPERAAFLRPQRRHPPIRKNLPLPKPEEKPFTHIDLIQHKRSFCNARNVSVVGKVLRS